MDAKGGLSGQTIWGGETLPASFPCVTFTHTLLKCPPASVPAPRLPAAWGQIKVWCRRATTFAPNDNYPRSWETERGSNTYVKVKTGRGSVSDPWNPQTGLASAPSPRPQATMFSSSTDASLPAAGWRALRTPPTPQSHGETRSPQENTLDPPQTRPLRGEVIRFQADGRRGSGGGKVFARSLRLRPVDGCQASYKRRGGFRVRFQNKSFVNKWTKLPVTLFHLKQKSTKSRFYDLFKYLLYYYCANILDTPCRTIKDALDWFKSHQQTQTEP